MAMNRWHLNGLWCGVSLHKAHFDVPLATNTEFVCFGVDDVGGAARVALLDLPDSIKFIVWQRRSINDVKSAQLGKRVLVVVDCASTTLDTSSSHLP